MNDLGIHFPSEIRATIHRMQKKVFGSTVDAKKLQMVISPLRICPLGAHCDHQGGVVSGFTIDWPVMLLFEPWERAELQLSSNLSPADVLFSTQQIPPALAGDWGNYARGACQALRKLPLIESDKPLRGFRGCIFSEMPVGGLSSSAAVTSSYLLALEIANNISATPQQNMQLVRFCENNYLGLNNGILDQGVILNSRPQELTVIDCAKTSINTVPSPSALPWDILVVYSGLSRQLVNTPFNARVAECKEAARQLLTHLSKPYTSESLLIEISQEEFELEKEKLNPVSLRRAAHFFSEQQRVRIGADAWLKGDWQLFGEMINQSGESSIRNYEAGCPELISLYEILRQCPGVIGTRFCGGGFKGCCFALVNPSHRDRVVERIHSKYPARHPSAAKHSSVHLCATAGSATVHRLEELLHGC